MINSTVIDEKAFQELVASTGGDPGFLTELINSYFASSSELFAQMQKALAENNIDEFRRAAHSLKSTSANLGALRLSSLARELEQMGLVGQLDGAAGKIARAQREYAMVQAELEKKRE